MITPFVIRDSGLLHTKCRIAVIGAGVSGLGVTRVFVGEIEKEIESGEYEIICFEKREGVGGIWLPDSNTLNPTRTSFTPVYDSLMTNLPVPAMMYAGHDPTPGTHLFPHAREVIKYLQTFEERFNLRRFIRYNTTVSKAIWNHQINEWEVAFHPTDELGNIETRSFDLLLVTNGHQSKPHMPTFKGLSDWERDFRTVTHSISYREPSPYRGLRVLIIGGGPSGNDLANEISKVARETIQSIRSLEEEEDGIITKCGRIDQFTADGWVIFESGRQAYVDRVILATGYDYDFSFLPQIPVHAPEVDATSFYNSGAHVYPLAQHLFPLLAPFPPHSIAFFGLPVKSILFPMLEDQALLAARLMAGKLEIDFQRELDIVRARNNDLLVAHNQSADKVSRVWFALREEQIPYRAQLRRLAGETESIPEWTGIFFKNCFTLRDEWVELIKRGEADSWVEGVGKQGIEDWVKVTYKLLERVERKGLVKR